jgi:hypothetical protein
MGRNRWKPNRISSSGRGCPDRFKLDQPSRLVFPGRDRTAMNCNPQIRRSGHIVQGRLPWSVYWADIPDLSAWDRRCLAAWQQCWQQSWRPGADPRPSAFQAEHIPSWRGSYERYALSLVGAASRWLLLLLSLLLSAAHRVRALPRSPGPSALRPSPHRTDCCRPIRRRGGVKGRFACTLTTHFRLCSSLDGYIGP